MADMSNYLEVARDLQGKLRFRTASESDIKWRELLEFAAAEFKVQNDTIWRELQLLAIAAEFHDQKDKLVHRKNQSKTPRNEEDERNVGGKKQVCQHVCCEHKEVMNADLHHELLQLIFARLSLNKILDLQCLSKVWKESLGARGDSGFVRACDNAHPKMFALVSNMKKRNLFQVRVFDTKFNAWHAFQVSAGVPEEGRRVRYPQWRNVSSEDGGLVLFDMEVPRAPQKKGFFRFYVKVMNPLTTCEYNLPPIEDVQLVRMKHIIVDRETNRYEVLIVVNRRRTAATDDIQVFHSETGRWSQPSEARDIMFGNQSAYDFAMGRLGHEHGNAQSPWRQAKVLCHTFLKNRLFKQWSFHLFKKEKKKNRLFVLLKDTNAPGGAVPTNQPQVTYSIKEYVVEYHPQHPPTWLEVDVHKCDPFEKPKRSNHLNSYKFIMFSSNRFLVVFMTLTELKPWHREKGWLYDLSTRTWRHLPKLPGDEYEWLEKNRPCEIRWSARPS